MIDRDGSVEAILDALEHDASDRSVLDAMAEAAFTLVSEDVVHCLSPHVKRLVGLDFRDHPLAALPAGVAICSVDRPLGRRILAEGRVVLEQRDDPDVALAWFLEGLQELGEGDLAAATSWWSRAHRSLDPTLTAARLSMAHMSLGAYGQGDLEKAVVLAEEALWSAEQVHDDRTSALAALYLGFFHLYTGRLGRCELMIDRAGLALQRLPEHDRYELPLVGTERGGLAAMRGDVRGCEAGFVQGLDDANAVGNDWYVAIALTARAEFTAHRDPIRAVADAQQALDYLSPIDETWWSRWARLALATAHLHAGNNHAGRRTCQDVLTEDLNPLERGRTLLVLADLEQGCGSAGAARNAAGESFEMLSLAGADYWAAQALVRLSRYDSRNAEFHRRRVRKLAADDAQDPAWRRLVRGPGRLDIRIMGGAEVSVDGRAVHFATRAEIEVIAMVVCAGGSLRTSLVADRLWPDDDPSKVSHRIDNLVSSLRRALLPTSRLQREKGILSLDIDDDECDLTAALAARSELMGGPVDPAQASQIAEVLHRPLLGGLGAPWAELERERLAELAEQTRDPSSSRGSPHP